MDNLQQPPKKSKDDFSRQPSKMWVPFGTISIPETSKELIREILETRRISSGKYVRRLEDNFAKLLGVKEAVAVSSGTDADILALAVLHDYGAQRGDEIIVPALSFVATGNAVLHAGFTPVFVDVDRETLNIDPTRIEAAITERTRALLPVHLMGKPADMEAINRLADRYGLKVIEDAAEAHGAMYRDKPVGGLGAMGAFSLYIAHIITTGEGGMVVTDNEAYGDILRSLRAHGRACTCRQCSLSIASKFCAQRFPEGGEDIRFRFDRIGYSAKMNELEAAIGLGNLENYQDILATRRRNLYYVLERFDRFQPYLATIQEAPEERLGPHAIPIVVQEAASFTRAQLALYLEENGVETRTLFASMPTQYPGFAFLGYQPGQFPQAEYIGKHGIHVGVHHDLGLEEMDYILNTLERFLDEHQR